MMPLTLFQKRSFSNHFPSFRGFRNVWPSLLPSPYLANIIFLFDPHPQILI